MNIRVLLIEESEENALRIIHELRRAGFTMSYRRVDTADDMESALESDSWDIVLSDYHMPHFSGLTALQILQEHDADIPFILVSDQISEETAVVLMKAGAHDYVMRDNLQRLAPAVRRELKQAADRKALKQSEESLRKSAIELKRIQDYYRSLLENGSDIIIVEDPARGIKYASPSIKRLLSYEPAELTGKSFFSFIDAEDGITLDIATERKLKCNQSIRIDELKFRHQTGVWRWFEAKLMIHFEGGQVNSMIWNLRDITDRKQAQDDLRRNEELFRTLAKTSTVGIFMTTVDGSPIFVNERMAEIGGFTMEEAISRDWVNALHPDEKDMVLDEIHRVYAAGLPYKLEHRMVHKDGTIQWVLAQSMPARDEEGRILSYVGTATDITDLKIQEENLRRLNRALAALSKCNEMAIRAENDKELLDEACKIITKVGGYALAWVGMADTGLTRSLRPVAHDGLNSDQIVSLMKDDLRGGPSMTALATRKMQVISNLCGQNNSERDRIIASRSGCKSLVSLPLSDHLGNTIGALTIHEREHDSFSYSELKILEELAADLSFGLSTIKLRQERNEAQIESQNFQKKLRQSLEDALQALAATTELRDPYTAGHQQRVAELAAAIARELGLNDERVHAIHLAGVVHDIGKIHIPSEILAKPTALSALEFELLKTHSQAGYDILKGVDFPWPIAEIVWQHHERLDGSGYPRGLKDDEILLESKIVAIADVVEAMSSHRPYRPSLGIDAALAEIKKGSGIIYDARAAEACINLFRTKDYHFKTRPLIAPRLFEECPSASVDKTL